VALAAQQRQGADAAVFLEAARGSTFLPPIAPGAAEITDLMNTTIERILSGRARAADVLPAAARRAREIAAQP
jgi:hypothetical protein